MQSVFGICVSFPGLSGFSRVVLSKTRRAGSLIAVAAGMCAVAAQAQSPALLMGNAEVTPGVLAQGYAIQHSVTQTGTSTTISYNVTPPSSAANGQIGSIYWDLTSPASATFTIGWSGNMYAVASWASSGVVAGFGQGASGGANPYTTTATVDAGRGSLALVLSPGQSGAATITVTISLGSPNGERKPYVNSFQGYGYSDYAVWRPSNGVWYSPTNNGTTQTAQWGLSADKPVPGDYDGDGITDYAVWRPTEGNWYVRLSSTGQTVVTQWGLPGDFPVAGGDYDGDGKSDYAVWRPSNGTWYVLLSSTGAPVVTQFGLPGDVPIVGNFDGDGKTDYVIWRASEGNWYVLPSSTGVETVAQWGLPGDIPVAGDYDGDGLTDYAIWRPSEGNWYVRLSGSNGQLLVTQLGQPADIPIVGDFNGDGKTDYAVWRPLQGNWYILYSGTTSLQPPILFGMNGDVPMGEVSTLPPFVISGAFDEPVVFSLLFPAPTVLPFHE